jgi:uncharacterized membrane protein YraQ (UPF0718 family)
MKKTMELVKRYRFFLFFLLVNTALLFIVPPIGKNAFVMTWKNLLEMISVVPPIFILLGLLDVWVDRETMIRFMGEGSGFKGVAIAFILGSAAAGPLYAAFPVAGAMMKKGAKLQNIFIFIGAWSTTKIPMMLFEASSLGLTFTLLRLGLNLVGITAIALIMDKTLSAEKKAAMIQNAQTL